MGAGTTPVIRTPDQRLRVFVSSTLEELAPERAAVRAAIERLHLIPVMFELAARPHPPAQLYRAYLDQSHVFLGIYWQRYGWTAPGSSVSGLEDEFVLSAGMPRLMYIKEPSPDREDRLAGMLGGLDDNPESSYRQFATTGELADLVEADLAILLTERFEASSPGGPAVPDAPSRNTPPPLSVPLTPTIGREADVDSAAALLRSGVRLLTITGVGGVGKTRLASEVTRAVQADFEEVRFVELGDLVDPVLVLDTIASALGVPVERSQRAVDAVVAAIDGDHLLLCLDNLEQIVGSCTDLADLLDRCPRLHLLVTSRQVLRLRGEHEHPLTPLTVPESVDDSPGTLERVAREPAVALFVAHAQAARPSFRLDPSNAAAVVELCRRLDGLPLAIELVATHIRLLPPDALLDRLGDRLLDVTSGSPDLPDRQRTLKATLDWSNRLLEPQERVLFARLAAFRGGASLDAVDAVCGGEAVGDVLETLGSLLEKSLVVMADDAGVGPRVSMLQTVRSYAWEQFDATPESAAVRDRHAAWFLEVADRADNARRPLASTRWTALDAELPNVRDAMAWLAEQDDTAGLARFAAALWPWYWTTGRMSEGRAWIEGLSPRLERPGLDPLVEAQLRGAIGAVRFSLGDHDGAFELLQQALRGFDAAGDEGGSAQASCLLAVIDMVDGDGSEAVGLATRAVELARRLDLGWGLAYGLGVLGNLVRHFGSDQRGRALQLDGLEVARRVGEKVLIALLLGNLAAGDLDDGNIDDARAFLAEAAACCRETRQMQGAVFCLEIDAALAVSDGRHREAAVLLGAADAIRDRLQIPVWPVMVARRERLDAALDAALGPVDLAAALAEGRRTDPFELLT